MYISFGVDMLTFSLYFPFGQFRRQVVAF